MNGLKDNELAAVRKLKETLTRDFGLVGLKLIGSKARGDSDTESDIDLVIVLKDYDWERQMAIYDVCFELSVEHDVLLSPIIYSDEEFSSPLIRATPFYEAVAEEGVPV